MTQAIILAAGEGKRLRPYTLHRPKAMVSLFGKPIIERQVEIFRSVGIEDIIVVTGYKAQQMSHLPCEMVFNPNFSNSNMVYSLFAAEKFFKDSDIIVSYADIVFERKSLEKLLISNNEIDVLVDKGWRDLWTLRFRDPLSDAESMIIDKKGFIEQLGKKTNNYQEIQGQYMGLFKIRADMIRKLSSFYKNLDTERQYDTQSFNDMYMTSFIQLLINDGWKVASTNVMHGWLELDSCDDLDLYEKLKESGEIFKFFDIESV